MRMTSDTECASDALFEHLLDLRPDLDQIIVGQGSVRSGEGEAVRHADVAVADLQTPELVEQSDIGQKRACRITEGRFDVRRGNIVTHDYGEILLHRQEARDHRVTAARMDDVKGRREVDFAGHCARIFDPVRRGRMRMELAKPGHDRVANGDLRGPPRVEGGMRPSRYGGVGHAEPLQENGDRALELKEVDRFAARVESERFGLTGRSDAYDLDFVREHLIWHWPVDARDLRESHARFVLEAGRKHVEQRRYQGRPHQVPVGLKRIAKFDKVLSARFDDDSDLVSIREAVDILATDRDVGDRFIE